MVAILSLFQATLTLPGMAGMLLTLAWQWMPTS
jgi:preprotein translocase subunit SecD